VPSHRDQRPSTSTEIQPPPTNNNSNFRPDTLGYVPPRAQEKFKTIKSELLSSSSRSQERLPNNKQENVAYQAEPSTSEDYRETSNIPEHQKQPPKPQQRVTRPDEKSRRDPETRLDYRENAGQRALQYPDRSQEYGNRGPPKETDSYPDQSRERSINYIEESTKKPIVKRRDHRDEIDRYSTVERTSKYSPPEKHDRSHQLPYNADDRDLTGQKLTTSYARTSDRSSHSSEGYTKPLAKSSAESTTAKKPSPSSTGHRRKSADKYHHHKLVHQKASLNYLDHDSRVSQVLDQSSGNVSKLGYCQQVLDKSSSSEFSSSREDAQKMVVRKGRGGGGGQQINLPPQHQLRSGGEESSTELLRNRSSSRSGKCR